MNPLISSSFYLETNPVGAVRQTHSDRWKQRPAVLRYRAYCDELRYAARLQNFFLGDRNIMIFTIAMPPSWSKKKKEAMNGKFHAQKPDLDNLEKSCADSLCIEKGDAFIHTNFSTKYWGYEGSVRIYNLRPTKDMSKESLISKIESDSSAHQNWF